MVGSHVEGDFTGRSLSYMPQDLFSKMKALRFLHTGVIPKLTSYPSLRGLRKLQYLAIVCPYSLQELPSLDDAKSLYSLAIVDAHRISKLPSLHAATKLNYFGLFYRNEVCCNGFMTGECDLIDNQCKPRAGEAVVTCSAERISAADLTLLKDHTTGNVCLDFKVDLIDTAPSQESTDGACGGFKYRQCVANGVVGMCLNTRMMVVHCDTEGFMEKMRRLQIIRRVGDQCDPVEEAWLGCPAMS